MQDLLEIFWFVFRFLVWLGLVALMAWGAGLMIRWLQRR